MRTLPAVLFALCAVACAGPPDAAAIRGAISAMAAAAETSRVGTVLEHVSADFVGNDGEVDRDALQQLLRMRLLAGRNVGVSTGTIDVDVDRERATARFQAIVTDGSGRWLPEHRAVLQIVTGWRRESGTWRCYNAHWSQGH